MPVTVLSLQADALFSNGALHNTFGGSNGAGGTIIQRVLGPPEFLRGSCQNAQHADPSEHKGGRPPFVSLLIEFCIIA